MEEKAKKKATSIFPNTHKTKLREKRRVFLHQSVFDHFAMIIMKKTLRFCVASLLVLWFSQVDCTQPPSPLVRYIFTPNDCNEGSFPNVGSSSNMISVPPLVRNEDTTFCPKGNGIQRNATGKNKWYIQQSPIELNKQVTNDILQTIAQKDLGISFEFWLKPAVYDNEDDEAPQYYTIMTLGSRDDDDNMDTQYARNNCKKEQFDLKVYMIENNLHMEYRTADPLFQPCYDYRVMKQTLEPGKLVHIILVLNDQHQQVFINGQGQTIAQEFFNMANWNERQIYGMHFFEPTSLSHEKFSPWNGQLYQFSIFDTALSEEQIHNSLLSGVPFGNSYAFSYTITLNEDAQIIPSSLGSEVYAGPNLFAWNSTQTIPLRIGSLSNDLYQLFDELNLSKSNLPTMDPLYIYITKFPSTGRLFHVSSSEAIEIVSTNAGDGQENPTAILVPDPDSIVFLPNPHEFSDIPGEDYTNLTYCVTTHPIFDSHQCESAQVSIVVVSVNDPPFAEAFPHIVEIMEGLDILHNNPSIQLGGSDVDQGDSVVSLRITRKPKWGHLILRVPTFRPDFLVHGTTFAELPNNAISLYNGESIFVQYLFTGGTNTGIESQQIIPGNSATDFFGFQVSDRHGAFSEEKRVRVSITSAVVVESTSSVDIFDEETQQKLIQLQGRDDSGLERTIAFFIETIPPKSHGQLFHKGIDTALIPGVLIRETFPFHGNANLTFTASSSFCDQKSLSSRKVSITNFSYRVVALDKDDVVSASSVVQRQISIRCRSEPLVLHVPSNIFILKALSLDTDTEQDCLDPVHARTSSCQSVISIDGIYVSGSMHHQEPVLVTILPGSGYVTFNDQFWHQVGPLQGRRQQASQNVTFTANPSALNSILSGLIFQSLTPGNDFVQITIQEGNCVNRHGNNSSVSGVSCRNTTKLIQVQVLADESIDPNRNRLDFPWQVLVCWIGYPALYALVYFWKNASRSGSKKLNDDARGKITSHGDSRKPIPVPVDNNSSAREESFNPEDPDSFFIAH